ncbi:BolA family transcriptional regulator [Luteimonas yindakuii]|uniref:BolA family protein n=1 Tax=Luteimonas yindakuii TaxID=2565782 RepID=UPI0010A2B979|nr:BolA family protein [Luteimonas yindakuii]QCO67101.1 BolA family transcriptional regulator [Luteimonas yindakuii]
MTPTIDRLRTALQALEPRHVELFDESHMHSRGTQTHYKAVIVSDAFVGLRAVQRHQKVYAVLGGLMQEIHALALHAWTPDEWDARAGAVPDSPNCRGGSRHDTGNAG